MGKFFRGISAEFSLANNFFMVTCSNLQPNLNRDGILIQIIKMNMKLIRINTIIAFYRMWSDKCETNLTYDLIDDSKFEI